MNILSLFDGMSCGQIALRNLGFLVDNFFASEIDKPAMQVTQANFPNTIQIGDVTKVRGQDLPQIDLMMAGSPCQGFSFSGKGLAFDDPRSALFFEFIRILEEVKPRYFLLENVKMKKEWEDIITDMTGVQPREINSNSIAAQNRRRLYWTNIPFKGDVSPREVSWGDIREHNVEDQTLYYSLKGLQWMVRHGERKNKILKIHDESEKMQMIEASHFKNYSSQRFFGIIDTPRVRRDFIMPNSEVLPTLAANQALRYISPVECERCQTVPDNYTASVSKTQRFKMLGNGWTVEVIEELLTGMDIPRFQGANLI